LSNDERHEYAKKIIERVEKFIKQVRDMDIIIDQKAKNIPLIEINIFGQSERKSLSDALALMTQNYELFKDKDSETQYYFAWRANDWIGKAYYYGIIKEGNGLIRKLEECNSERDELREKIETISTRNLQLEFENHELHARLDQTDKMQKIFKEKNK